jgi:hypothetical protein
VHCDPAHVFFLKIWSLTQLNGVAPDSWTRRCRW